MLNISLSQVESACIWSRLTVRSGLSFWGLTVDSVDTARDVAQDFGSAAVLSPRMGGSPAAYGPRRGGGKSAWHWKLDAIRLMDIAIALAALLFFGPAMILIAAIVRSQDGGAAIFSHQRIGVGGRAFGCLKFRSMVVDAPERLRAMLEADPDARAEWERDQKLRHDPRITAYGNFLRKTSLDELPQLLNVLKGEMSIVGPRPIVASEIAKYGRYFRYYIRVPPGITGMWQVSGRNDVEYDERVALDVLYVKRRTIWVNMFILIKTVPAVLNRRGSY
jgi:exopolysaccharide production protein ExoY